MNAILSILALDLYSINRENDKHAYCAIWKQN